MQDDYKSSKEAFVSHQSGSTVAHVNLISSVALCSIALYSALQSRFPQYKGQNFLTDFIILVIPLLLSMTVFANQPLLLDAILVLPTCFLMIRSRSQKSPPSLSTSNHSSTEMSKKTHPDNKAMPPQGVIVTPISGLTAYRAQMLLMTFLSILAVDFPVFPRSLAKCETFGVSLMDLGVGSFVFSQGVVSAIPLLKNPSHLSAPLLRKLMKVSRKMLPVTFLGLLRVIIVKGTEYPEHVSEYGTHWNFFITLALLPPLQVLLHPIFIRLPIFVVGMGIAFLHQLLLSNTSLQEWTLNAPRAGIIAQNKEGLVSLTGYLAIHVLGLSTGTILFVGISQSRIRHNSHDAAGLVNLSESRPKLDIEILTKLMVLVNAWWSTFALVYINGVGGGVSRRLANAPYILWVAAYNVTFITYYFALDAYVFPRSPERQPSRPSPNPLSPASTGQSEPPPDPLVSDSQSPRKTSMLLEAINLNGLPLFLLANIATGLVNLTVRTMYTSDTEAMVILSLYAFGISVVAWIMKGKRLWKM